MDVVSSNTGGEAEEGEMHVEHSLSLNGAMDGRNVRDVWRLIGWGYFLVRMWRLALRGECVNQTRLAGTRQ